MDRLEKIAKLHKLILEICKDKYAIPEMMAERIIKEVDVLIPDEEQKCPEQSCSKCKFFNSCYWQERRYNDFEGQGYEENDCGQFEISTCKGTGKVSREEQIRKALSNKQENSK